MQCAIKPTRIVSGYGDNGVDKSNFVNTNSLYLLSGVEVFGEDSNDMASSKTSQLDYYSSNKVTASNYGDYVKKTV